MAILKKGSRKITVDNTDYRWTIRRKPTYSQANGWSSLTVAIELYSEPKSKLVVTFPFSRPDNWIEPHGSAVTPKMVADSIRQAKKHGWRPSVKGPTLSLDASAA